MRELHTVSVTDSSIEVEWEPPTNSSSVTDYMVTYQKLDNATMDDVLGKVNIT